MKLPWHTHHSVNWGPNHGFCFSSMVFHRTDSSCFNMTGWLQTRWLLPSSLSLSKTAQGWAPSLGAQSMECLAVMSSRTTISRLLRAGGIVCILLISFSVSFNSSCFIPGLWVTNDVPTLSLDDYKEGMWFSWPISYFLC